MCCLPPPSVFSLWFGPLVDPSSLTATICITYSVFLFSPFTISRELSSKSIEPDFTKSASSSSGNTKNKDCVNDPSGCLVWCLVNLTTRVRDSHSACSLNSAEVFLFFTGMFLGHSILHWYQHKFTILLIVECKQESVKISYSSSSVYTSAFTDRVGLFL